MTADSGRRGVGTLTLALTQEPFLVWASHMRLPGRESGEDADPSVVPTEWPTLQLSGSLPGHLAHVGLESLLKWGLHTHPGVGGGRRGTGSRGKWRAGRSGTEVLRLSPPLPPPPCTLCGHPCPNLTFIGKSIRPGGPFQTSQETQWGRGSCGLGHSTKTPGLSWRGPDSMREKAQDTGAFDFKGE